MIIGANNLFSDYPSKWYLVAHFEWCDHFNKVIGNHRIKISTHLVKIVNVDSLAPLDARTSAGTVIIKLGTRKYSGPTLEGLSASVLVSTLCRISQSTSLLQRQLMEYILVLATEDSLQSLFIECYAYMFPHQCQWIYQWRHNERDGVSNHQTYDCLLNRLFKAQIK